LNLQQNATLNILYLGYWSAREGITHSTLFPHLQALSGFDKVKNIIFCSIERDAVSDPLPIPYPKCRHIPLLSKNLPDKFINKWYDFRHFPATLKKLIVAHAIDICIGAGTQAGTLVLKAAKGTRTKVIVSYFDPHAQYMRALGVWPKYDPRYLFLHHWEEKLKKEAYALFPVSRAYRQTLLREGVSPEKLFTVPCTVDLEKFTIDNPLGQATRQQLGFAPDDWVGIYVGKFGDIYFDDLAFKWFGEIKKYLPGFKLIILTGQDKEEIAGKLINAGFAAKDFFIGLVPHNEVPAYLNAADWAFSLIRPHKFSHAYSPIKHGEYWACGLPVVLPEGIGDDSKLMDENNLGVVIKNVNLRQNHIDKLIRLVTSGKSSEIRKLAFANRNPDTTKNTYKKILATI